MQRTQVRFQLSAWLAVAAAVAYLCRNSISVAEKTIRADLDLSEDTMGFILGPAFFWTYALAQIPGGWSGQRFGSRRMLPVLSIAFSAATALMAFAQGASSLLAGRILGGIAQAGLFPCSALSISRWHPQVERALASGILGAAMSVGAAVGAALTGELLEFLNWRLIFCLYAVPGLVWAVLFYGWFRETPREHPGVNQAEEDWIAGDDAESEGASSTETGLLDEDAGSSDDSPEEASISDEPHPVPWRTLIKSVELWQICGQQFFRAAGAAFFGSWFPTYLQEVHGVTTSRSGWLLTIPLIAMVAASLTGGVVSDAIFRKTKNLTLARSALSGCCLTICTALFFTAVIASSGTAAALLMGAGVFFGSMAGPCAYASTMDVSGRNVAPVFSTMNMIGNFGAGLLPFITPTYRQWAASTPWFLDLVGGNSWSILPILFGSMYFLAAMCWATFRVKEGALDPGGREANP